jgi:cob(II)yrinic acid a,c-diamide reductase
VTVSDTRKDAQGRPQPVDPTLYRDGMARYAGHVQAVTTEWQGVRRGVTATAACSVSDDPATVLVCLNATNDSNAIFEQSGVFALNSLAGHHQALAKALAGFDRLPVEERFALAHWLTLETGAPVLSDALVSFDCRLMEIRRMSTHLVLFGQVVAMHFGPHNPPLIYLDRAFHAL